METMALTNQSDGLPSPDVRAAAWRVHARHAAGLAAIGVAYFALAKFGLALASINPSATPVWPPTGFALAVVLLWGYRVWPAIFIGAFTVNALTAGSLGTSLAIATGNTLECLMTGYLINRWSNGKNTFETPMGVVRFAALCLAPGTLISATIGVGTLALAGYAAWGNLHSVWITWWLGDTAGALVITPVLVLWLTAPAQAFARQQLLQSGLVVLVAVAVGLLAFSPLLEQTGARGPLSFLAILPLILAAVHRGQRDTALAALLLSGFAIWGTLMNGGPFARDSLNDSFLMLLAFIISTAAPSLVLSADAAVRKRVEQSLREAHEDLNQRVSRRTTELEHAIEALQGEVEERSEIETKLLEQRVHLLEAQRMANLGSWVWDIPRNKVTWSEQIFEIYGLSPDAFQGTFEDYLARVHADDRDRVRDAVMRAYREGGEFRIDERIVRPSGEVRHLLSTGKMFRDDHDNPVRMLGICHDITERRQAQAALDDAREKLAQSQKMEALGQLTGGIAHDFNNLLMIVSGHAQMLKRGIVDESKLRAIEAINTASSRGGRLTRQLLAFSRIQRLTPVVIDVKERIEAVREMIGSSLRGNIQLDCDFPDGLWPTEVDLSELELALLNISVNARDAMPDGGRIVLSARNVTIRRGQPPGDIAGDFVAIGLADSGAGIAPDILPKVFEPFFTTKDVGKGTGLGLSQVYGFAHQSGGSVAIESEPGLGTTITMYLPRSQNSPLPAHAADEAQPAPAGEGTVLLVEDNPDVADVTAGLLGRLGYRVLCAESAPEALERLQQAAVDLVFSDVVMPGPMDGLGLAREVRARHPHVPVLLTSGYSDVAPETDREFRILRKPFDLAALDSSVREALRRPRYAMLP
jgi:PAS domain S-box-containing protein